MLLDGLQKITNSGQASRFSNRNQLNNFHKPSYEHHATTDHFTFILFLISYRE